MSNFEKTNYTQTTIDSFFQSHRKLKNLVKSGRSKIMQDFKRKQKTRARNPKKSMSVANSSIDDNPTPTLVAPIFSDESDIDDAVEAEDYLIDSTQLNNSLKENSTQLDSPSKKIKFKEITDDLNTTKLRKPNFHELSVMKEFCSNVLLNENLKYLLYEEDREMLSTFLYMPRDYQYLVMKLFVWQDKWYNIYDFARKINLTLSSEEVDEMYEFLKSRNLLATDYMCEDLETLLGLLDLPDLKDLFKRFKMPGPAKNKANIITQLLKSCKEQAVLVPTSMREVLKNACKTKLGNRVKMMEKTRNFLYRVYLLNTFPNPNFSHPRDYFSSVGYLEMVFPEFEVDDCTVFQSVEDFNNYAEAVQMQNNIDKAMETKKIDLVLENCRLAFNNLKKLVDKNRPIDTNRPSYFERFSAISKYISILTTNSKHLTKSNYIEVKEWLEYFLKTEYVPSRRAAWYEQLSLIYTAYLKLYEDAAQLLLNALEKEGENFSERQLSYLAQRAKVLKKKSYKVPQEYFDRISELCSSTTITREYPSIIIPNTTIRDNVSGQKRRYVYIDSDGGRHYISVEEVARKHYLLKGFSNAEHYENTLMSAIFCLCFWDIIYGNHVPGVFVSKVQTCPLDMHSKHFYLNRKEVIEARLKEIAEDWEESKFYEFVSDNFKKHAHRNSICRIDKIVANPEVLLQILSCIDRKVLAKILERLAINYREHQSGLPDLFVWDVNKKTCKFVEVKGEGDKLSIKQRLWLNYLLDNNADVEVCHVHSTGSRRSGALETFD